MTKSNAELPAFMSKEYLEQQLAAFKDLPIDDRQFIIDGVKKISDIIRIEKRTASVQEMEDLLLSATKHREIAKAYLAAHIDNWINWIEQEWMIKL
jgi:hypothetical protein